MKNLVKLLLVVFLSVGSAPVIFAGEHGGQEHGGKEHGGTKVAEPSKEDIRSTMKNHVLDSSNPTGAFEVKDPDTGKTRKLKLLRVHERVGKTGEYYYSCADFEDLDSGEQLDLDIDVQHKNGNLSVADVRIHKVSGEPRYTYDENDNRIPLKDTKSHLGTVPPTKDEVKGSLKGSQGKEHGGKEHGGKEHGGN